MVKTFFFVMTSAASAAATATPPRRFCPYEVDAVAGMRFLGSRVWGLGCRV